MVHGPWGHNTICELVLIGKVNNQEIINVHAFEASAAEEATFVNDGVADTSAQGLRDDWIANLLVSYRAIHGTGYSLVTVGSQIVERPATVSHRLGRQDRSDAPLPAAGTAATAGGMLPIADAAVVRWRSLVASRSARGRTYFGGLPGDWRDLVNTGQWTAGFVTALDTYANTLRTRYSPGGAFAAWNLTVYSRPYTAPAGDYVKRVGGALTVIHLPDYAGNSNFVTSHVVDGIARTQRRREVGVGA